MRTAKIGDRPAARCPLDEAELEQIRLVDVLDRLLLLAERHRQRREADRAAPELDRDRLEQVTVGPLEADAVDLVELERLVRDLERDRALVADLGDVAHAAEDAVGDTRSAPCPGGDLVSRLVHDVDAQDPR